jgi:hypothetical protein
MPLPVQASLSHKAYSIFYVLEVVEIHNPSNIELGPEWGTQSGQTRLTGLKRCLLGRGLWPEFLRPFAPLPYQ